MNTTLTNDQITAGAAVLCDHGQPIGRNAAIAVFDAMRAASPQVADIADVAKFKQAFHEASRVGAGYDEAVAVGLAASRRAAPRDVCAEMRALCSACGGTGDVVSLDGEWRGTCDCEASRAPASAGQAAPALPDVAMPEQMRYAAFDEIAAWYAKEGWLLDEDDVPDAIRALAAQPAEGAGQAGQVAVEDKEAMRERVRDAVARALHGIYYCGRVWDAWDIGTMGEDDFTPAAEVDGVLDEIIDAAIGQMGSIATERAAAPADHEIREAVNQLRDVAVQFHAHQSLRDRIAAVVLSLARATRQPSAQVKP